MGRNTKTFMFTTLAVVAGLALDAYATKNIAAYRALTS